MDIFAILIKSKKKNSKQNKFVSKQQNNIKINQHIHPLIALKQERPMIWYIFEKEIVQGPQKQCSQVKNKNLENLENLENIEDQKKQERQEKQKNKKQNKKPKSMNDLNITKYHVKWPEITWNVPKKQKTENRMTQNDSGWLRMTQNDSK